MEQTKRSHPNGFSMRSIQILQLMWPSIDEMIYHEVLNRDKTFKASTTYIWGLLWLLLQLFEFRGSFCIGLRMKVRILCIAIFRWCWLPGEATQGLCEVSRFPKINLVPGSKRIQGERAYLVPFVQLLIRIVRSLKNDMSRILMWYYYETEIYLLPWI